MSEQIQLSDMLAHVTDQLRVADKRSRESGQATMRFDECELELAVNIEKNAKGGIKVWVLELGGGRKKTESNTIRIKFKSLEAYPMQAGQKSSIGDGPSLDREQIKNQ
jgi:Trypsin-co-occurring domain 2